MVVLPTALLPSLGVWTAGALPVLFVLLAIEEAGVPIPVPGDTLIMLAGAVAIDQPLWFAVAVVATSSLAAIIGSSLLFFFMHHGGRAFIERFGRWFFLGPRRMARVERWFARRHRYALVLGRLIPGLRIPTTALAGLSGLLYRQYLRAASLAAVVWSAIFFSLGALLRLAGPSVLRWLGPIVPAVRAALPVPVLALLLALVAVDAALVWLLVARILRARAPRANTTLPGSSEGARRGPPSNQASLLGTSEPYRDAEAHPAASRPRRQTGR